MYFSTSTSGNQRAAKIVAVTAREFGLTLSTPEYAHIPFESVTAAIARAKDAPPDQVARDLLLLDPERRRQSLRVGSAEIVKGFGSEAQTMEFFRQAADVRAVLRFDGVGGVSEDIAQVKNRLAAMASDAYLQRQSSDKDGFLPVEREYVDLMKSVRRNLEFAVEGSTVPPDVAEEIVASMESAVARVPLSGMGEYVQPLHEVAREELFAEAVERVRKRYAVAPAADGPDLS
ncbi:hypothetical protein [Burkholderia pseudomallei]|uniref:hypothetical protein n=1 Tax=Burkholderia pseudomallei TaxID=28450 RepID=UPI000A1A0A26|nr:hypothetical protein [Burkholderia pseudomallei]ARL04284.1 hypothetical protein BOC44_21175 [Burkholderia pseudomallei]